MRAVVQRVLNAGVTVDGECVGRIGRGYLVLLGVGHGDTRAEADKLWEYALPTIALESDAGVIAMVGNPIVNA